MLKNEFQNIKYIPIWGNSTLNIPFDNKLFSKCCIFLKDLIDNDGNFLPKMALEIRYERTIMFTTYFALTTSIPRDWRALLQNNNTNENLQLPPVLEYLNNSAKGRKVIRQVWQKDKKDQVLTSQTKWKNDLVCDNIEWKFCFQLPDKSKLEARTRFFQYQVLHRTLITNRKLHLFNLRGNEQCDTCLKVETITHLLYECQNANAIWHDLGRWISQCFTSVIHLDKISVLIGNSGNEYIINSLIIITKHEIY